MHTHTHPCIDDGTDMNMMMITDNVKQCGQTDGQTDRLAAQFVANRTRHGPREKELM